MRLRKAARYPNNILPAAINPKEVAMNLKRAVPLTLFLALVLICAGPAAAQCKLGVPAIKVGVQGAASGPHADYGRQIEMGATLAMEEINAGGGVAGCKVEIRFL